MADFWDEVRGFCHAITAEVGDYLITKQGTVSGQAKSDGSLVTECDQWSDDRICAAIRARFPEHGVLSEETVHIFPAPEWCWIIDPIDGTTNFTRGLPLWGISLGLLYQGVPVFGYVAMPMLRQCFYGYWPGNSGLKMPIGAYCNGQAICTSQDDTSSNHFFNLCARSIEVLQQPVPAKIRMLGVATYNLLTIAMGAALGGVEATPKIWDIVATWVIVQAAGGIWKSLDQPAIFPLQVGQDYGQRSFPTLVVARSELLPIFEPLVQVVVP